MWFVLRENVIYAFKASEDLVAVETFPILGYDLVTLSEVRIQLGRFLVLMFY